jgi:hypothetical protein
MEISLRGNLDERDFGFYYFAEAPDTARPNPRYKKKFEAIAGNRYIFFLMQERGCLRSIGDVGEYSIRVASGAHPGYSAPASDLVRGMADVLLKKGEGADLDAFAHRLRSSVELINRWGSSRIYSIQLLKSLLVESEPLRRVACQTLVDLYTGQYGCLDQIRDDPEESSDARQWATTAAEQAARWERQLIDNLEDPANLQFGKLPHPDSRISVREELESLLSSPNTRVRGEACVALRRFYPHESKECDAAMKRD